jgi:hypothetical protein
VLVWSLALVSLVLPWVGAGLALVGGLRVLRDDAGGWLLLGAGAVVLAADLLIDFVWARRGAAGSDEPDLSRRGAQSIGQTLTVVESSCTAAARSASATRCGPRTGRTARRVRASASRAWRGPCCSSSWSRVRGLP